MIISFANRLAEHLYHGETSKETRKLHPSIQRQAIIRLTYLNRASCLEDLRVPPGNRLEALIGDRKGFYSIRINQQWRIVFLWTDEGPVYVEIVDYHS